MGYLNWPLYTQLTKKLGEVRVTRPGKADVLQTVRENGWPRVKLDGSAEHYNTNCPFCGDQRRRLSIHFRYGSSDPIRGEPMIHLAKCFNENCLADAANRQRLWSYLFENGRNPLPAKIRDGRGNAGVTSASTAVTFPRDCFKIEHAVARDAANYLKDRRFQPDRLWRRWGVMYCWHDPTVQPRVTERIVVPYYHPVDLADPDSSVNLVGWIARRLREDERLGPKYLMPTGFNKAKHLYGLTQAIRTSGPIVVVEGVTDVWRLRTNTVALIGTDCSDDQQRMLFKLGEMRPIVIFLDDDAGDKAIRLKWQLVRGGLRNVLLANLPRGRQDVGECKTREAWSQIEKVTGKTLVEMGVDLRKPKTTKHPCLAQFFEDLPSD